MEVKMNWLNTQGGPILCCSASTAQHWQGIRGNSAQTSGSDYARACEVRDYVGVITCADQFAVVLGDEPLQSTFIQTATGLAIARWVSCAKDTDAAQVLASLPGNLPELEAPKLVQLAQPGLVMFDAAMSGDENKALTAVALPAGAYQVTSQSHKLCGSYEFLIHRFVLQA